MALTIMQANCLRYLAKAPNGMGSADEIARGVGYRPARSGRLAVTSCLRRLIDPETNAGNFIHRISPRDQWAPAVWSITKAGRALVSE